MTPKRSSTPGARSALAFLTIINLLNYVDRQVLYAVFPAIKADLGLSDTELGALASAFMVVYLVLSPFFGWWGDRWVRMRIVAIATTLWSAATAFTGAATNLGQLFAARALVGVGEAGYGPVSPTLVADYFPREHRGAMLAVFYLAIPVGSAGGYLLGGLLQAVAGWRAAFLLVGIPGVVIGTLAWFRPEPARGASEAHAVVDQLSVPETVRALLGTRSYVLNTLALAVMTFAIGALAAWWPTFLVRERGLDLARANYVFGVTTLAAGIIGTFAGGVLGDFCLRYTRGAYFLVSGIGLLLSAPAAAVALLAKRAGDLLHGRIRYRDSRLPQHRAAERASGQRRSGRHSLDRLRLEHLRDPRPRRRSVARHDRRPLRPLRIAGRLHGCSGCPGARRGRVSSRHLQRRSGSATSGGGVDGRPRGACRSRPAHRTVSTPVRMASLVAVPPRAVGKVTSTVSQRWRAASTMASISSGTFGRDRLLDGHVGRGVARHEELAAVLVRLDRDREGAERLGMGRDFLLVHSDEGAKKRQRRGVLDDRQIGKRLRGHLTEAVSGHEGGGADPPRDGRRDADHHAPIEHDARALGNVSDDLSLHVAEGNQMQARVGLPATQDLEQLERLLLAGATLIRRAVEMDELQAASAPHHPVRGDGRVDASREQGECGTARAHRQSARTVDLLQGEENFARQNLDVNLELRVGEVDAAAGALLYGATDHPGDLAVRGRGRSCRFASCAPRSWRRRVSRWRRPHGGTVPPAKARCVRRAENWRRRRRVAAGAEPPPSPYPGPRTE